MKLRRKRKNNLLMYSLKLPVFLYKGAIVDIETNMYNEIITFGCIVENKLISVSRMKALGYDDFKSIVKQFLKSLPNPLVAYNVEFEKRFLEELLEKDTQWIDLMDIYRELSNKRQRKFPKLKELVPSSFLEYYGVGHKDISNKDVFRTWKNYTETNKVEYLDSIALHNVIDLLAELYLFMIEGVAKEVI